MDQLGFRQPPSIRYEKDGYQVEEFMTTISAEEVEAQKIARVNEQALYLPAWTMYEHQIAEDYDLTHLETLIYGYIKFFTSNTSRGERVFFFKDKQLAELYRVSVSTVAHAMANLHNKGLIVRTTKVLKDNGAIRKVRAVTTPDLQKIANRDLQKIANRDLQKIANKSREEESIERAEAPNGQQSVSKNTNQPYQEERRNSAPPRFDEFWALYPRKIGKQKALATYKSSIKKASSDLILKGLEKYVHHWKIKETDQQYIPHPATWLNQGRWEDELTVTVDNSHFIRR